MPDWEHNDPLFPGNEIPDEICYDDWGSPQSCDSSFFDDMDNPGEVIIMGTSTRVGRGFSSMSKDSLESNNNLMPILMAVLLYRFI